MTAVVLLFVFLLGWLCVDLIRRFVLTKSKPIFTPDRKDNVALQYTEVILPDMFQSFLKDPPRVNPHYVLVKLESEKWLSEFCAFDKRTEYIVHKCDFSYFCCISAPFAAPIELRTLCDWGNWVFPYDDMFDNGHLRNQPEQSRQVMESLMAAMERKEYNQPKLKVVQAHDTVVERIAAKSPIGVQDRFARTMRSYATGALKHVSDASSDYLPTLEEMILVRRESAGVSPLFHLVEYAHGLDIPEAVFNDPSIRELEALGIDMVSISNDILSYRKEEGEGVPHNMVAVSRMSGMSAQEAFNAVGEILEDRYRRWDLVASQVRSWGPDIDTQVQGYIEGIKCVVKANMYWSFKSERYLGRNAAEVRRTRKISVLAHPPFLSKVKN